MHNLHLLLQRLADARFEFVVIGGYAGVLHGSALVTNDLDICAVLSPENVPPAGTPVADLYLETDGGMIDVLSSVLGIGEYARLKASAEEFPIFGRRCAVISLEDLITAKEAVGREKDLLAAKELRAIAAKRAQG